MVDELEKVNLTIYNVVNDAIIKIFNKHKRVFQLSSKKIEKELNKLRKYQNGSKFYSHLDTLSKELHNPFILEKAANDYSYWLIEMSNCVMELITRVADYAAGDTKMEDFTNSLEDYVNNLPKPYEIRKHFLDQVPIDINYDEVFWYNKKDWLEALDTSVAICDMAHKNSEKIITMIDLLSNYLGKLKMVVDNPERSKTGLDYLSIVRNVDPFIKYEMNIHTVLEVIVKKMTEYSVVRLSDLVLVMGYIDKDINAVRGELWR